MTGEEIRARRKAAYVPQGWLAKHAGITQRDLSFFEVGDRPLPPPAAETIGKLVEGILLVAEMKYPEAMALFKGVVVDTTEEKAA